LNLKVVAEGVETESQFWFLKRNFCDEVQGYLFQRPVPFDDFSQLLYEKGGRVILPTARVSASPDKVLLLLDDEPNILRALSRLLRRDGYRILTASTPQQAFALLAENDVQVVMSDQRMPEMTGTEFFRRVKEMYPDTIRLILSGYTDLKSVTDAINHGAIYRFLTKPWDDEELRREIAEAFKGYQAQESGN
jgi:response regulator RpfG family c-di-GMP phosphodiesterase